MVDGLIEPGSKIVFSLFSIIVQAGKINNGKFTGFGKYISYTPVFVYLGEIKSNKILGLGCVMYNNKNKFIGEI